jgi:hypothetical protein
MINLLYNTTVKSAFRDFMTMVLFLSYCNSVNKNSYKSIKTITIITNLDFVMVDKGELIHVEDSFRVFYYQDLILYQVPQIYEVTHPLVRNDTIEEKIISSEIRYKYFVYKVTSPFGYKYDSLSARSRQLFSVDSFLSSKAYAKFKFYDEANDTLVQTIIDQKTKIVTEKYLPRIKYDETYPDSSYRYFSDYQLKNVEFSFSKYLDSIKNKKLFKVIFIYNPIPKGKYPFDVPRRSLIFEMKKTLFINTTEIIDLFERVKHLHK